MANPQPDDAHLRIAHSITEAIMLRDFTKRQRKVLDLILRLSWGCGKKTAIIPSQSCFSYIGVGKTHIKQELDWLETSKIIVRDDAEYQFNKDFDQWQVSRVFPFEPHKVTELVTLNLKQGHPKVTELVTTKLPKQELSGYRNSNITTPELASPKESIKEILNKYTTAVREILEELLKLPGWGNSQLANDAEWLSEFLVEYPAFTISHIRQCRDYHSDKRSQKKSSWKSRLRNWMKKDRVIQAQGDRHESYRGNPSQKAAGAFDDLES